MIMKRQLIGGKVHFKEKRGRRRCINSARLVQAAFSLPQYRLMYAASFNQIEGYQHSVQEQLRIQIN